MRLKWQEVIIIAAIAFTAGALVEFAVEPEQVCGVQDCALFVEPVQDTLDKVTEAFDRCDEELLDCEMLCEE